MAPSVRQVGQLKISATSACACRTTRAWATCLARRCSTLPQRSQIGGSTRLTRRRPMMPVYIIRARLGMFHAIVRRSEVPARALRADHPEATLPLVEREPPSDPEPRGAAVAVERAVAEGAGAVHNREQGAGAFVGRYCSLLPAPSMESIQAQRGDVRVGLTRGEEIRRDLAR